MQKNIIVAIADNRAIGKDNALLWHISEDLKYFKSVTSGSPVIMGRKTYESIGRPLPGRKNIVISRSYAAPEGVVVVKSLEEAYEVANAQKCFVIGGGQIYAEALDGVDRIYMTKVHTVIEDADTFFPEIDMSKLKEESRSETFVDTKTGYSYEFYIYGRNIDR